MSSDFHTICKELFLNTLMDDRTKGFMKKGKLYQYHSELVFNIIEKFAAKELLSLYSFKRNKKISFQIKRSPENNEKLIVFYDDDQKEAAKHSLNSCRVELLFVDRVAIIDINKKNQINSDDLYYKPTVTANKDLKIIGGILKKWSNSLPEDTSAISTKNSISQMVDRCAAVAGKRLVVVFEFICSESSMNEHFRSAKAQQKGSLGEDPKFNGPINQEIMLERAPTLEKRLINEIMQKEEQAVKETAATEEINKLDEDDEDNVINGSFDLYQSKAAMDDFQYIDGDYFGIECSIASYYLILYFTFVRASDMTRIRLPHEGLLSCSKIRLHNLMMVLNSSEQGDVYMAKQNKEESFTKIKSQRTFRQFFTSKNNLTKLTTIDDLVLDPTERKTDSVTDVIDITYTLSDETKSDSVRYDNF